MRGLNSSLFTGWVRHRRFQPKSHAFRYPVFMSWIDLDELDSIMKRSRLWSKERFNLVSFYRKDYIGDPSQDLKQTVGQRIYEKTGHAFDGRICLLTNLRYLGYSFNPVSFYFCYSENTEYPRYILAEINNTPWDERYCYLLDTEDSPKQNGKWTFEFDKAFHVSPFMPMNLVYDWRFSLNKRSVTIHMSLKKEQNRCFDATLQLQAQPMERRTMRSIPLRYPFMTLSVVHRIYWQAFRLRLKRIPFYEHPNSNPSKSKEENHECIR